MRSENYGSVKTKQLPRDRFDVLVLSRYKTTECNLDIINVTFYQKMRDLLRTTKPGNIANLAAGMNAALGRLFFNAANWGSSISHNFCCPENIERFLNVFWPRLSPVGTKFKVCIASLFSDYHSF